jgi:hypothetical protein
MGITIGNLLGILPKKQITQFVLSANVLKRI